MKKIIREIFSNGKGQLSYMRISAFICLLMAIYNNVYMNLVDKDLSSVVIIFLTAAFSGKVGQSFAENIGNKPEDSEKK